MFRAKLRLLASFSTLLAAYAMAGPVQAQVCEDSDGDGWGWDGSASCLVSAAPVTQPGSTPTTGSISNAECVDSDGDGYGWDGTASCVVTSQNSGQAINQPAPDNSGSSSECVDDDGDGWGWNGFASCRVGGNATPANIIDPPQSATTPSLEPVISNAAFNRQRDLVALHFDHAPDRDDGHAAVAALMVRDQLGLNVQVVAGTCGFYSCDRYDAASEPLMASVWGSEWHNAHSNFEGTVQAAVNRWTGILAAGGSVWIAEGGPADFTAEVVRRINNSHSEFDTRSRIHVIQHSNWNEDHSLASDLDYARNNTRYVKIADGNNPNATADFRLESHSNGAFVARAQSSSYSSHWAVAFNYLSPNEKLDFSDAVELMHIVGIGTSVINNVDEFADYFF